MRSVTLDIYSFIFTSEKTLNNLYQDYQKPASKEIIDKVRELL
jgi:hypothetical protein